MKRNNPKWAQPTKAQDAGPMKSQLVVSVNELTVVAESRAALVRCVEGLLLRLPQAPFVAEQWENAREVLESLPLTTAEFGLALNRLTNARDYADRGEVGPARFELHQLLGGLLKALDG